MDIAQTNIEDYVPTEGMDIWDMSEMPTSIWGQWPYIKIPRNNNTRNIWLLYHKIEQELGKSIQLHQ